MRSVGGQMTTKWSNSSDVFMIFLYKSQVTPIKTRKNAKMRMGINICNRFLSLTIDK